MKENIKKIRTLLIDDEVSATRTLRGILTDYFPQVHVLAEARSVKEAIEKIHTYEPDLIFLDIEMPPNGSGFDILQKCKELDFGVIFITAYPKYAIQAINAVQPWAYLVKPYSVDDLEAALKIAADKLEKKEENGFKIPETKSLIIPDSRKGNQVIRVQGIIYCKADGATSDVFYRKEKKLVSITAYRTLKEIEEQLPEQHFSRCHHSYIVNLNFVERYERTHRNGIAHLIGGGQVPISIAKMPDFEEKFKQFLLN